MSMILSLDSEKLVIAAEIKLINQVRSELVGQIKNLKGFSVILNLIENHL